MEAIARARYKLEVGWDFVTGGNFKLDISLLGGPDELGAGTWLLPFTGPYDDVTADVDEEGGIQIQRGRSDDSGPMQMGEMTVTLVDATGKYNRKNPASPLAGKLNPMVPVRLTAYGPGVGTPLAASGNEITDTVRALSKLASPPGAGLATGGSADDQLPGASSYGIWRAATNLHRNGQADATTDWAIQGSGITLSVDATTPGVFSANSIKAVTTGLATNQGLQAITALGQALPAGTQAVASIWFKGVAGQPYIHRLQLLNTDASTTNGSNTTFTATGAWQLLVPVPVTVAVGKTGDRVRMLAFISGTRAETLWAANAMIETGVPYVSPYVATAAGATATRAAARVRTNPNPPGMNAGLLTVALRVRYGFDSTQMTSGAAYAADWRDSATERVSVYYDAATGAWRAERASGGASSFASVAAGAFARGGKATIVAAFSPDRVGISVNGGAFAWATNTSVPSLASTQFDFGQAAFATPLNGDVLWAAVARGVPIDKDVAGLAAVGDTDPGLDTVADVGWPLLTWAAVTNATVVSDGPARVRFFGWVRRLEYEPGGRSGRAVLTAVDFFLRAGGDVGYKPKLTTLGATTTGGAIGRMLDAMEWTTSALRAIDTGDSIPNFSTDGTLTVLDVIETLLEAERGAFFVSAAGVVTYRSRGSLITALPLSTITNVMSAVAPGADLDTIVNSQTVTKTFGGAGTPQVAKDNPSVARYGERTGSLISSDYLSTDAQALSIATWIVKLAADPQSSLWTLNLSNRSWSLLDTILQRDLLDAVTITEAQTGTTGTFQIQQISETIRRGGVEHSVSWLLRARNLNAFVLGTSQLGSSDVLA